MAFSAKQQKDGAEDLTSDGSVTKSVLVEGGGEKAQRGAKVTVKYSMRLSEDRNSQVFDSSEKRKDGVLRFTLGRRKVIPALEIVTQSMKLGETCEATVEAPYAFGSKGLKRKGVPPDARIYIQVEMVACEGGEKVKTMAQMTPSERFTEAQQCKESGNNFFKELKYEKAMSQYSQCIRYLSNVFYKPNASLSGSGPASESKSTAEAKGSQSIQPAAVKFDDSTDANAEAEQEQPNEEGFQEAKILEGSQDAPREDSTEQTEEVETIDVSTALQEQDVPRDVTSEVVDATASTSAAQASASPGEGADIRGSTPGAQEKSAEESEDAAQLPAEDEDPNEKEVVALHVTTLNNLSLCLVKLEDYKRAVETASVALRMDPENYKAFYYRGRAQIALGDWDKARSDLISAAKIQPNNIGIRMEIQKLDKKKKLFVEKEKKQAAAMFA